MENTNKSHFFAKIFNFITISLFLTISFSLTNQATDLAKDNHTYISPVNLKNSKNNIDFSYICNIDDVVSELFGRLNIQSTEYLYNLDNSPDYIYVEFDEGYAVFLKETMELMEYSPRGKINYPSNSGTKYYGGPSLYMYKNNNYFVNILSKECFFVTKESAQSYASDVRKLLLLNFNKLKRNNNIYFDYSTIGKWSELEQNADLHSPQKDLAKTPDINSQDYIMLGNGTYIPNYRYFLSNPQHGVNNNGTCGAVASQLLLSYHNYYSDRRIIKNYYLNGGNNNPEDNPNLCQNPMSMTSAVLGTTGENDNDEGTYYNYVVSHIPPDWCTTSKVERGLKKIMYESSWVNNAGRIDYTISSNTGGWRFGFLTIDSDEIISVLDSGNPLILLMQRSLGGLDHYVVAYGYSTYNYPNTTDSYLGYITHFGYGEDKLNVWVNSLWCHSYVSLNIKHTHKYIKVGAIAGTNNTEYKCYKCGHRTDAAINMYKKDRYIECFASIPQNKYYYKDFYVTFESNGNKLFQTYGNKDTEMFLYDTNNKLLIYDNDSGINSNSLFNYEAEANVPYILRVKFHSNIEIGDIKIGITPSYLLYSTFEDIRTINSNLTFLASLNSTCIMKFQAPSNGRYVFKTSYIKERVQKCQPIDTFLYVVDPFVLGSCISDDDSGGNSQACISINLIASRTYFIIVSAFDITTTNGIITMNVNKIGKITRYNI